MKKIFKAGLTLTKAAIAAGAAFYGLCSLVDNLLVNRYINVPEKFGDMVSGADMTALKELSEKNMKWLESYGYEIHAMVNDRGEKLMGYLLKPEKTSNIYVLGAHGYTSDGRSEFCGIAQYYLSRGVNVFLPDHTASGASEGKYIGFGYYESTDCLKWLYYLKKNYGEDITIILHGVSMGAATVMMMSGSDELPQNVKIAVSDCGYTGAWDEFEYKLNEMKIPCMNIILDTVNHINKKKAGYDFKAVKPVECVKKAKIPMLFIHGGGDTFVPTFMGECVYNACNAPHKELLIVDGADHAQSFVDGREEYEEKLDKYLDKFVFEKEKVEN